MQNHPCAASIVEQYTHTKTRASSAYKNTPRNSTVQTAATQKLTQNAQQTSQLYSRSWPTMTRWLECGQLVHCNSSYTCKNIVRTVLIETFIVKILHFIVVNNFMKYRFQNIFCVCSQYSQAQSLKGRPLENTPSLTHTLKGPPQNHPVKLIHKTP